MLTVMKFLNSFRKPPVATLNNVQDDRGEEEKIDIYDYDDTLNSRSRKGRSAVHKAVASKNIKLVEELILLAETNMNIKDNYGNTPLHEACAQQTSEMTKILVTRADVNQQNTIGESPLHVAVKSLSLDNVSVLLEEKAKVNLCTVESKLYSSSWITDQRSTALHYAFSKKRKLSQSIVLALLQAGADLNLKNAQGESCFYLAMQHPKISEAMSPEHFNQLVEKSDLTVVTNSGATVLHAIAQNKGISLANFSAVLTKCEQQNADLLDTLDRGNSGHTALYYLAANKAVEKIDLLLAKNVDTDLGDMPTPLLVAARNNDTAIVKRLLAHDTNPNVGYASNSRTALIYAAKHGNIEMIEALKEAEAYFYDSSGRVAVEMALVNNHIDALIRIIRLGADPQVHVSLYKESSDFSSSSMSFSRAPVGYKDKTGYLTQGDTPLHFAVKAYACAIEANDSVLAKKLYVLAETCIWADPSTVNAINKKDRTPAHFAIKVLNSQMAHLLKTEGDPLLMEVSSQESLSSGRTNSLLMQAATRGFSSTADLYNKFFMGNYTLSAEQEIIKKKAISKYQPKPQEDKSVGASVSVTAVGLMRRPSSQIDIAPAAFENEDILGQASTSTIFIR